LAVLVAYTLIKICFIHIDLTIFNQGNLLNWLDHGLNFCKNLQNVAELLCAYSLLLIWLHWQPSKSEADFPVALFAVDARFEHKDEKPK